MGLLFCILPSKDGYIRAIMKGTITYGPLKSTIVVTEHIHRLIHDKGLGNYDESGFRWGYIDGYLIDTNTRHIYKVYDHLRQRVHPTMVDTQ